MKYIPLAASDRSEMLKTIGANSVEDLFEEIPAQLRLKSNLDYPKAQSELELRKSFAKLRATGAKLPSVSFAGAGIYQHDIPSIVPYIQSRAEYSTAYTPYQPEISQGMLQSIFEFQTLCCQLLEMELSNASLYDGATSLGEGVLMALRIKKKSEGKILISEAIHPFYIQVLNTYLDSFKERIEFIPIKDHKTDLSNLELSSADILVTQSPNIFGCIEDYSQIQSELAKNENKTLWVTSTMEPLVFGLMKGPGAYGAHVATAEGQSFGNEPYLGGSSYGLFATKQEYIRNLPGRLVGETVDEDGKPSFVLTFATREQFIRRGKATSNICTNNNLNMIAGLIHLAALGKEGIRLLARQNFSKTEYLKKKLRENSALKISEAPTFNEFTVELPLDAQKLVSSALSDGFVCGVDLGRFNEKWKHKLLINVSELHSKEQLDQLAGFLQRSL